MIDEVIDIVAGNGSVALIPALVLTLAVCPEVTNAEVASAFDTLKPRGITVHVQNLRGEPLSNTTVVAVRPGAVVLLDGTDIEEHTGIRTTHDLLESLVALQDIKTEGAGWRLRTDALGSASFFLTNTDLGFVSATKEGFGWTQIQSPASEPTITVRPWGQIEGVRINNGHPVVHGRLQFTLGQVSGLTGELAKFEVESLKEGTTDSEGRFVLAHVPPGKIHLYSRLDHRWFVFLQTLEIKPGETNRVELSTQGKTLVGRLKRGTGLASDIDLATCSAFLDADVVDPQPPREINTYEKVKKWMQDFLQTEGGRRFQESKAKSRLLLIQSDGSFRAEIVSPGRYKLGGAISQGGESVAKLETNMMVPATVPDREEAPFDVGNIVLRAVQHLKVGDAAPEFRATTLDDHLLKLSNFRGGVVLLYFWATWCGPCIAELSDLKEIHDLFGKDERFVMVGLSLDSDREHLKEFVRTKGIGWPQVFLRGETNATLMQDYHVTEIPSVFLIGQDGKIVARNLRGAKIKEAVTTVLAHPLLRSPAQK